MQIAITAASVSLIVNRFDAIGILAQANIQENPGVANNDRYLGLRCLPVVFLGGGIAKKNAR